MLHTKDKVKHLQLTNANGLIQKNIKMKSKNKWSKKKVYMPPVTTTCGIFFKKFGGHAL